MEIIIILFDPENWFKLYGLDSTFLGLTLQH